MSGYLLFCTVCNINYSSEKHWNLHLINGTHQKLARKDLCQWDEEVKKCALVIYSNFSLVTSSAAGAETIIEYFSNNRRIMVSDFIMTEARPRTAIVQFESEAVAMEIFSSHEGPTLKINDKLVQVRELWKLLELEWEELVLSFQDVYESSAVDNDLNQRSNKNGIQLINTEASTVIPTQKLPSVPAPKVVLECSKQNDVIISMSSIREEFQAILQEMKIPDDEFTLVEGVIRETKLLFTETIPECTAGLYRYNYLKLRNSHHLQYNEYLIFMHAPNDKDGYISGFSLSLLRNYFDPNTEKSAAFPTLNSLACEDNHQRRSGKNSDDYVRLIHPGSGTGFKFSTHANLISELQLSRLVAYYCEFDSRIRPLLTLLYYWSKTNDITIARKKIAVWKAAVHRAPDPVCLEWLLLFFLIKYEKLMPTPAEIMRRPHEVLKLKEVELDVGFDFDIEIARNWQKRKGLSSSPSEGTDEFILSVIDLLFKFFRFFGERTSVPWFLSTRDGILLTEQDILTPKSSLAAFFWSIKNQKNSADIPKVVVLHPFAKYWRLSVDNEKWGKNVQPLMLSSAQKLRRFLNSLNNLLISGNHEEQCSMSLRESLCAKIDTSEGI